MGYSAHASPDQVLLRLVSEGCAVKMDCGVWSPNTSDLGPQLTGAGAGGSQ